MLRAQGYTEAEIREMGVSRVLIVAETLLGRPNAEIRARSVKSTRRKKTK